jgi:2-iminobutanoate/2-iminopropanoate deaminase
MSVTMISPPSVHTPGGPYSHGVSTGGPGRTLFIAGQIGLAPDGTLAAGFTAQATQCWRNLVAILEADGMTVQHLVKVNTYLTDMAHAPLLGPVRESFLGGARPASTLVATPALVCPEWLIEVEAIAFRPE